MLSVQSTDNHPEHGDEHDQAAESRDPDGQAERSQQGQVLGDGQRFVAKDPKFGLPQCQGVIRHRLPLGTDSNAAHCEIRFLKKTHSKSIILI